MFQKLGIVLMFVVCLTTLLMESNAQEIQARFARGASSDCSASLAAKPGDCCKMPVIFDEKIISKCKTDFGDEPPPQPAPGVPPPGCCLSECLLNATKILVDGKYDKNQAVTIVKASTTDSKWVDVILASLDKCEKEQNELKDKSPGPQAPSDPANRKCGTVSGAMITCVKANMFQNCPDYSSEASCTTLKPQIAACPIALMKKL